MSVSLAKPVQPVDPYAYLHTRQWRSTVDLAVETGYGRVYERLCENDPNMLQVVLIAKIYRAEGRRHVSDHLYETFGHDYGQGHDAVGH